MSKVFLYNRDVKLALRCLGVIKDMVSNYIEDANSKEFRNEGSILSYLREFFEQNEDEAINYVAVCNVLLKGIGRLSNENIDSLSAQGLVQAFLNEFQTFVNIRRHFKYKSLVTLTYKEAVLTLGHSNLTRVCRGCVVDTLQLKVIARGYDKFHNLNECDETSEKNVALALTQTKEVYLSDKLDGTNILVTPTETYGVLFTTNGSFDDNHIRIARKLIEEKHVGMLEKLSSDYTYMFECLTSKAPVCIQYDPSKNDVYLTGMRNLKTGKLLLRSELEGWGRILGVQLTAQEVFTSVNDLIEQKTELPGTKEGWVCRILMGDDRELIFKLKTDAYLKLGKAVGEIAWLGRVIVATSDGNLDDLVGNTPAEDRLYLDKALSEYNSTIAEASKLFVELKKDIIAETGVDVELLKLANSKDKTLDKELRSKAIKYRLNFLAYCKRFGCFQNDILTSILYDTNPDELFRGCNKKKYLKLAEFVEFPDKYFSIVSDKNPLGKNMITQVKGW